MMKCRFLIFLTAIIVGVTVSCGPPKLTRDTAEKLIESSNDFINTKQIVSIYDGAAQEGISQGYWYANGTLTDKGRQFFAGGPYKGANMVMLSESLKRKVIAVTGITDAAALLGGQNGGTQKEAQFNWEYIDVPAVPKRFICKGGTGKALFRLYDDGWRVESIDVKVTKAPFELSAEEKLAAEKDREEQTGRPEVAAAASSQSNIDNRIEQLYNIISTSLTQVENAYQRRADILPSLIGAVKAMETNEKKIISAAIDARSALGQNPLIKTPTIDMAAFQRYNQSQGNYSSALSQLLVAVNKYPEIGASSKFKALQAQLEGIENRITAERLRYNEAASEYNSLRLKSGSGRYPNDIPIFTATGNIPAPKVRF